MPFQFHPFVVEETLPDEMVRKGVRGQRIAGRRMFGQHSLEPAAILERQRAKGWLRHGCYRADGRVEERNARVRRSRRLRTITSSWNDPINSWLEINTLTDSLDSRKAAVRST